MKTIALITLASLATVASASSSASVEGENSPSVVYLEVTNATGGVIDRGTGFIVSEDGYMVTAAHLKVAPDQKLWGVIGQREGARLSLNFRDSNERQDVALWQFPQSLDCKRPVTLGTEQVVPREEVVILGFPLNDGLTVSTSRIGNVTSRLGFYKADGYLQPGNSGGPVFNAQGHVVAIVQGGTLPGTANNDLVPIGFAIDLIRRHSVKAKVDADIPPSGSCLANPPIGSLPLACVVMDDDGDGVNNCDDQCPASKAGQTIGQDGCPVLVSIDLKGVNFDFGTSTLRPDALAILDEAIEILKRYPKLKVEVAGHADSAEADNEQAAQTLGKSRATATYQYLVSHRVDSSRLIGPNSYGARLPVAPSRNEDGSDKPEGQEQNRRVELNTQY